MFFLSASEPTNNKPSCAFGSCKFHICVFVHYRGNVECHHFFHSARSCADMSQTRARLVVSLWPQELLRIYRRWPAASCCSSLPSSLQVLLLQRVEDPKVLLRVRLWPVDSDVVCLIM